MNTASIRRDFENDGILRIIGASTLVTFKKLYQELTEFRYEDFGIFVAYTKEQFKNHYDALIKEGRIREGEELVKSSDYIFGTKAGFKKLDEYLTRVKDRIKAECDPQEVYWYEYNNGECFLSWDGDAYAIKQIIHFFGIDAARNIRRISAEYSIDELLK